MKSRHIAREIALQILYRYDVNTQSGGGVAPKDMALADDLKKHFEHFQVAAEVRQFAAELVVGTLSKTPALDEQVEKFATNWKISRMALIDRNLLRMAIYEMTNFTDIPASVTIDEAIELAKQFGTADSSAFINGILDALKKEIGKA
ncbi:MAG: transcription antitermination factor NusB [Methylotenera sp.]|nr:transcription antitermination factor NusB [Oligoflexia bacterium]